MSFPKAAEPKKKKKKLRKYERADGRFCKYVTIDGVKKPIYGTSTEDVINKAAEYKDLVKYGLSNIDYEINVRDWCDMWFATEMSSKGHGYKRNVDFQLRLIKEQIGHLKVKDVREIHLQRVLNSRSGMSSSQIAQLSNAIKAVFSSARKNRLIRIDPSEDITKPKGTYKGHRALEDWEIDLLLNNVDIHQTMIWASCSMLELMKRVHVKSWGTQTLE